MAAKTKMESVKAATLYTKNLLAVSTFKTKRKYEVPKAGKHKKTYNSLDLDAVSPQKRRRQFDDTDSLDVEAVPEKGEHVLDNSAVLEQDFEELARQQGMVSLAVRQMTLEMELDHGAAEDWSLIRGEDQDLEEPIVLKDLVLEVDRGVVVISNQSKIRLPKSRLVEISSVQPAELDVLRAEFEFFKPMRIFERSAYIRLSEPTLRISATAVDRVSVSLSYQIQLKECCVYTHPLRTTTMITKLVSATAQWDPVPGETPYPAHVAKRLGYHRINTKNFYNMISDVDNAATDLDGLDRQLVIPELETELFAFQRKTVNWLLDREGVQYDEQRLTVEEKPFAPADDAGEDRILAALDLLSFGWSRVRLPADRETPVWYNRYTGNLLTSKFARYFLSTVKTRPGAEGLLAEEMGLGKTVEIISLVLLNARQSSDIGTQVFDPISHRDVLKSKTTLIICPDSILKQWYQEISNLAPSLNISIYKGIYHYNKLNVSHSKSAQYRSPLQIAKFLGENDILLASYQTVAREIHHALYNPTTRPKRRCARASREKIANAIIDDGDEYNDDGDDLQGLDESEYQERNDHSSPLVLMQFWRVILDEVQMVSSKISNAAKIAKIIPRYHSWGVSGTPIRKDLHDLHAFLAFAHLFPFNDNLPSPKQNRQVWAQLVSDSDAVPYHFIRLFKRIALRHTKSMVSDEIRLPPQKRILFTSAFTPVERNLYDHMFQDFLALAQLNEKGDPLTPTWEPNGRTLSIMRECLIRLRQACCHSEIGTGNITWRGNGAHGGAGNGHMDESSLRTVDAVLEIAIEDNENAVLQFDRRLILTQIEQGQLYETQKQPQKSLKCWSLCLEPTTQRIQELRATLGALEAKWTRSRATALPKEDEVSLNDKLTAARTRLRSWLELLHRLYFFIASAHYQIYTPNALEPIPEGETREEVPDEELGEDALRHRRLENEFYDKAELLRRELLSEPITKVNRLVQQVDSKNWSEYQIPAISSKLIEANAVGLQAQSFVSTYLKGIEELNGQAKLLNEWILHLSQLMNKKLKDDIHGEAQSKIDENEYEDSLVAQEQAYAYLEVLQLAFKDRSESLVGSKDQYMVSNLITRLNRADDDDELGVIAISQTGEPESELVRNLRAQREAALPSAASNRETSLKSLLARAKDTSDSMLPSVANAPKSVEWIAFNKIISHLKVTLDSQKKILLKVRKEGFEVLNDLYNSRIEYYKSLQAFSDNVQNYDIVKNAAASESDRFLDNSQRLKHVEQRIQSLKTQKTTVMIRAKYLKSLQKTMYKDQDGNGADPGSHQQQQQDDEKFCIICQSSIVTGVLTACGHQYCKDCLNEWLRQSRHGCPMCKAPLDKASVYYFTYTRSSLNASMMTSEEAQNADPRLPGADKKKDLMHSIYHPIEPQVLSAIQEEQPAKSYGSKIDLLIKVTKFLAKTEKDVQIVIFSQWSELLYLIGTALRLNKIQYLNSNETLNSGTGSGRHSSKITDVDVFKKNKNVKCFLLNAKAQASGLTLVNASHVFLCEPLVNTALELQAISRIHRIGQKRQTTVWMFVIENTVEESIVKLATKKRLEYLDESKRHPVEEEGVDEEAAAEMNEQEIDTVNTQELTKTVEGLVDKKVFGGEVVSNDDLWSSFFS